MKNLKSLLNSKLFLFLLSIGFTIVAVLVIVPISTFISQKSLNVVSNFYLAASFMLLLAIASIAQALLIVRLIWGSSFVDTRQRRLKENELDFSMRNMKATGAKKSFVFGIVLAVNIIAFDYVSGGVLVTGSKRYHVLTRLRSIDGQQRADAVPGAIQLTGDKEVASALRRILEQPGEAREWAIYAAGIRRDRNLNNPIANLLRTGNARERAAAAVALARLEDPRLIRLVIDAWPHFGKLKSDALIALGMVGKKRLGKKVLLFSDAELQEVGRFLSDQLKTRKLDKELTRLAIWCLNKFESPQGLPELENLLSIQTDLQTLCVTLEALGNIGAADTSPKLVEFIQEVDKSAHCKEMIATDFTGKQVLLCSSSNLVARIIFEIGHIGDSRAVPAISRLAENPEFKESIRNLAKEFVFKMQYRPPQ